MPSFSLLKFLDLEIRLGFFFWIRFHKYLTILCLFLYKILFHGTFHAIYAGKYKIHLCKLLFKK